MTPMPQLVKSSTHKSGLRERCGLREWVQWGLVRTASHQCRPSRTDLGAWRMAKSFGNLEMKEAKGGKVERPSLYIKEMCWRVLRMDMACLQEIEWDERREVRTFSRYFRHFFGERETEWSLRFHTKPT